MEYYYLNDTPRDAGSLEKKRLQTLFGGSMILFSFTQKEEPDEKACLEHFNQSLNKKDTADAALLLCRIGSTEKARDFLGVLKTSRKRIKDFLNRYMDTRFMDNHLQNLNKTFAALEYMRAKNNDDTEKIWHMLSDIHQQDTAIVRMIKNNLKMEMCVK